MHIDTASPSQDLALLPPAARAAVALNADKTELELRELVKSSADVVAVADMNGRDMAHRIGMNLKTARVAITKTGKAVREDATAFRDAVIAKEKELIGIIEPEETRVLALRDAYDAKVREEKEAAERHEAERKSRIECALAEMRAEAGRCVGKPAAQIAERIGVIGLMDMSADNWMEYHGRACEVHADVLDQMQAAHEAQLAVEAAAARAKAEAQAEAERVRLQAEENARLAAQLKAQQEAMEARQRDELAERERVAAEQAKAAQEAALRLAEQERIAAQRLAEQQAELDAKMRAFEERENAAKLAAEQAAAKAEEDRLAAVRAAELAEAPAAEPAPAAGPLVLIDHEAAYEVAAGIESFALASDGQMELDAVEPAQQSSTLPLSFEYDEIADVLTVEGINYSGDIFRQMGGMMEVGQVFQLTARADGVLCIYKAGA